MLKHVDWRELVAANQRTIHEAGVPGVGASGLPGLGSLPGLADLPGRPGRATGAAPPGLVELPARPDGRRAFVHAPPGTDPARSAPLLLVLHGCTQSAADVAGAMGLSAVTDRVGWRIAYAQQGRGHNPRDCWNWFEPAHQARGTGEPAFLADVVAAVGERWTSGPVFLVGFSAGGAMAAVAAAAYPDLFAGLGVHSGLAFGAARSLPTALMAMRRGGPGVPAQAAAARRAMGDHARLMPTIALHGTRDAIVAARNGEQVVEQWRETNRLVDSRAGGGGLELVRGRRDEGRAFTRRRWHDAHGRPVSEHVAVDGMGHAWSGGTPGGSYADPRGPSAAEAIVRFFGDATG
ncbi:MAG TPA: PHB depolymerase family esterase [Solirubrobacteraceae bacterium]|nr:PHB depolymerase family esterase [Solirubrobacteraceae bacterium]